MPQRILVVRPDSDDSRLMRLVLESWGYTVSVAESRAECVELARRQRPDLILVEDLDARDALEREAATSVVPVLALSHGTATPGPPRGNGSAGRVLETVDPLELQARIEVAIREMRSSPGRAGGAGGARKAVDEGGRGR